MKKQFFTVLLVAITVLSLPFYAQAAEYPVRAIKGIVPYGAGGSTDVVFRAITAEAEKFLGQPIAIVNKKGAGGSVGGNFVAKSRPDGYTILLAPTSVVDIYPNLTSEPAYVLGDLIPVCMLTVDPRVFVVRSDLPWKTVKDLVEAAKKSPDTIRFGSPGVTSWGAFGYYALQAVYPDVKFSPVPLRGHSDIVTGMLRGEVEVASGTFAGYKAQVDAGKLKPIGIASDARSKFLPDVPTCKEVGIDMPKAPNVRYVWVPKGTPMKVQKKLEGAFKAMCELPVVIKRIETLNQNLEFRGGEEAMKTAKAESEHFKVLIERFGLKIKKKK